MGRVTLGLASSHSPQLSTVAGEWGLHVERDRRNANLHFRGRVFDFDGLREARSGEQLDRQLAAEVVEERFQRCDRAVAELRDRLQAARPDVLIVVGDDQRELFLDDGTPALAVFWGDSVQCIPPSEQAPVPAGLQWSRAVNRGRHEAYRCDSELGLHLVESLVAEDFDVAQLREQPPGRSIGHAFNFVHNRLQPEGAIPIVPLLVNTYYPPNQPRADRCYALGQALGRAIERWDGGHGDTTVGIVASGGLSHFVVDEELDGRVLDALRARSRGRAAELRQDELVSGTSEIRNWLVVAGATEHLELDTLEYVPCYRSEAGTGVGMGFASWSHGSA
ncbi:MAG: hypothetical protein J2P40_05010 [Candidatus Dormibacteraeota bacterium]|nr:hypothetical protein [Candidatus Dormibacteraeota bacterium]MBO0760616.1 hypothetical protein [Candidatus Dormibacteraeota bacterium]